MRNIVKVLGDRRYPKNNIITTIVIIKNVWTDSNIYYYGSASLPPWKKTNRCHGRKKQCSVFLFHIFT